MNYFKYDELVTERKERMKTKVIKLRAKIEKLENEISELDQKISKLDHINAECDERYQMKAINSYKKNQLENRHTRMNNEKSDK